MSVHKDEKNKTKDGRIWYFKASYDDLLGNKHIYKSKKYKTKMEAKEDEYKFIYSHTIENKSHMTFEFLFKDYFNNCNDVKGSTLYSKESRLRTHALPFFARQDINKISTENIKLWKSEIERKNFSINYKQALFNSLSSLFKYAVTEYNLNENPCSKVGNFKHNVDEIVEDEIKYITLEQFKIFDSVIDNLQYKALFNFFYYMGTRKGETLSLKWTDIDFTTSKVKIVKTLSSKNYQNGKKIGFKETNTKNKKNRYLGMPSQLKKLMLQLYRHNKKYTDFNEMWYVFGGSTHLGSATIDRYKDYYFDLACKIDQTIPRITNHQFRHSHASYLISNNIPPHLIAERLGDTVEIVLKTYAHLFPETEKQILDLLENI